MKPADEAENNILYVGIDLGTSRSSISASNNTKECVESYVGWPRDFISARVLGKDILFGSEALGNRLSLDVYRPLERGVIKEGIERNEEAVKELIGHLISLARPPKGQKINAIVGVPADTLKVNKLSIRKAVLGYVHSLMVVSEPFAVAYGLELLNNSMIIDIGAGTVDFCIMHGAMPAEEDQKTILTAGDYIDEQLFSYLSEKYPGSKFTLNMVRQFKEKSSFVGNAGHAIQVELPVEGKLVTHDITNEIKRACESILPAIIDTTASMIARFDPEFQVKIKNNIVVAGGGSRTKGIAEYLHGSFKELFGDCRVSCVEDPLFAGSDGSLKLAMDMPKKYWEQL
ncbi:MAG: MamK family actin-like protein [Thermodesulfovibrionales bacterium]|nr:MamK family actin-like protein [Thermodesulfovibrionales bacterium]